MKDLSRMALKCYYNHNVILASSERDSSMLSDFEDYPRLKKQVLASTARIDTQLNTLIDLLAERNILRCLHAKSDPALNSILNLLKEMLQKNQIVRHDLTLYLNLEYKWSLKEVKSLESDFYQIHIAIKNTFYYMIKSQMTKISDCLVKLACQHEGSLWTIRYNYQIMQNKVKDKPYLIHLSSNSTLFSKSPIEQLTEKVKILEEKNISLQEQINAMKKI